MNINLIAAVGKSGQLGLDGMMPWHDLEDLQFFKAMTMGKRIIFGIATLVRLPVLPGRELIPDDPMRSPEEFLARLGGEEVWIGGGAKTYARYLPLVRRSYITHIDYDGPSDVNMPALWPMAA